MPTTFSHCDDCTRNSSDMEKCQILNNFLPIELAIKIIKLTYSYSRCHYCNKILCNHHIFGDYESIGNFGIIEVKTCKKCLVKITNFF